MCQNPLPGSEDAAAVIIKHEIENIITLRENHDDIGLLAALQAYLIYTMVLFFRISQAGNDHLRQAMIDLQEFAHASHDEDLYVPLTSIGSVLDSEGQDVGNPGL